MSRAVKFLIGFAATLLMGWLSHGPLGRGEALVAAIEQQAKAAVAMTELPGIGVRMARDPLSRTAVLSGEANDLQREGLGSQFGVNDYVRSVEGISGLRWNNEEGGARLPLLAETLILLALAYLLGLALAWLFWGRPKRESFL